MLAHVLHSRRCKKFLVDCWSFEPRGFKASGTQKTCFSSTNMVAESQTSISHPRPMFSKRIQETDDPIMVQNSRLLGGAKDVSSLGQGAVYWGPCKQAVDEAVEHVHEPEFFSYNFDHGLPALRERLLKKIQTKNGLHGYGVSVTAGANQALASLMITLLDPQDRTVVFRPYYFNALMAVQMMGGGNTISYGPSDPDTFHPDLDWLEEELKGPNKPQLVYLVNPCNPTGVTLPVPHLQRLADLTAAASCWLVIDNTYEQFLFSGKEHKTINAPHICHVFSFSKSYGLMGWRVGYIAYPDHDGSDDLGLQLIKTQDTIPIHSAVMSQKIAINSLDYGEEYTLDKIDTLKPNREQLLDALSPLGTLGKGIWGGDAIYFFARLPKGCEDDVKVVKWLAFDQHVAVIPGSGHIRIAFGRPAPGPAFEEAAAKLKKGLTELVSKGMPDIS